MNLNSQEINTNFVFVINSQYKVIQTLANQMSLWSDVQ